MRCSLIARWAHTLDVPGPAQAADLARAAEVLGEPLPPGLRALLAEFDGLVDAYGTDVAWPTAQVADTNRE